MSLRANKRYKRTAEAAQGGDEGDAAPQEETEGPRSSKNMVPCSNLRHCIERWKLMPPFSYPENNSHWADYYLERATLDFRCRNFFLEEGGEVKTLASRTYCQQYKKECRDAGCSEETANEPSRCRHCGSKILDSDSDWHRSVDPTPELREKWGKYVNSDECLRNIIVADGGEKSEAAFSKTMPRLRPHCASPTYAKYNHPSRTVAGEYQDLISTMRDRVKRTLMKCPTLRDDEAFVDNTISGLYVKSYKIQYDEDGTDETPHTVEIGSCFYSPVGSGSSVDLVYYYHVDTDRDEKYSIMNAFHRTLEDGPVWSRRNGRASPTDVMDWRGDGEFTDNVMAILDGDSEEHRKPGHVRKSFCTLSKLRGLRDALLGERGEDVSPRKVFAVLARAAGAGAANPKSPKSKEGGWVYAGMRNRYELYPGEESDEEENGPEEGPSCVIC